MKETGPLPQSVLDGKLLGQWRFIYLFGRERFRFSAVLMSALCVCVHSEKLSVGLNAAV